MPSAFDLQPKTSPDITRYALGEKSPWLEPPFQISEFKIIILNSQCKCGYKSPVTVSFTCQFVMFINGQEGTEGIDNFLFLINSFFCVHK